MHLMMQGFCGKSISFWEQRSILFNYSE